MPVIRIGFDNENVKKKEVKDISGAVQKIVS